MVLQLNETRGQGLVRVVLQPEWGYRWLQAVQDCLHLLLVPLVLLCQELCALLSFLGSLLACYLRIALRSLHPSSRRREEVLEPTRKLLTTSGGHS